MEKGRNNDIELNEEKTKKTKENTNRIGQYKGIIQKGQGKNKGGKKLKGNKEPLTRETN